MSDDEQPKPGDLVVFDWRNAPRSREIEVDDSILVEDAEIVEEEPEESGPKYLVELTRDQIQALSESLLGRHTGDRMGAMNALKQAAPAMQPATEQDWAKAPKEWSVTSEAWDRARYSGSRDLGYFLRTMLRDVQLATLDGFRVSETMLKYDQARMMYRFGAAFERMVLPRGAFSGAREDAGPDPLKRARERINAAVDPLGFECTKVEIGFDPSKPGWCDRTFHAEIKDKGRL